MGSLMYAEDYMIVGDSGSMVAVDDYALRSNVRSRFQQAVLDGDAYSWACLTADPAAGATVFALENNDSARTLYLQTILLSSDTVTRAHVFGASGITVAGTTAVSGVNINRASGNLCQTTAYTLETGQNEAASSWPNRFYAVYVQVDTPMILDINGAIALPNDHMIGVDYVADVAAMNVTFVGWFE